MELHFSKMHALGNDFMVIDATHQKIEFTTQHIQLLGSRHRGVGFDQLLIFSPSRDTNSDFIYRIYNASGDEVSQCGNGARCIARYIHEKKISDKLTLRLATKSRVVAVTKKSDTEYAVDMGIPEFTPSEIPFITKKQQKIYPISVNNMTLQAVVLSMGNPHMVIVTELNDATIDKLGPQLMKHDAFPEGVNVGFLKIVDPQTINLRVFERGVGETQACGSGACAAVVAGRLLDELNDTVQVFVRGGRLTVFWRGNGAVEQTGPTTHVYDAVLSNEFLR